MHPLGQTDRVDAISKTHVPESLEKLSGERRCFHKVGSSIGDESDGVRPSAGSAVLQAGGHCRIRTQLPQFASWQRGRGASSWPAIGGANDHETQRSMDGGCGLLAPGRGAGARADRLRLPVVLAGVRA